MIADVLEASFAAEAALVPNLPPVLHEASLAFENQDGFTARWAVALGSAVSREAGSAQESGSRADILNGKSGTNGRRIGVYGSIGREGCRAEGADETGEGFLRLEYGAIGFCEPGSAVQVG